ncbi:hypothetical protein PHSY_000019 [Pseudozyma hubeiensis SY62]|uniref:Uncharacterized protein n=1 Tax=Pseudozyma hubeiensis (strain SY62) TaxID=1305764 RepID=R9NVM6_PSEHS|nr:hypothetical protein PHSY_000019 [Pseudozyma hubeiensis SY62]GAC92466.1 hypothetical protein PHSY_000019 [Pseudozyma hubeiensis SY62]
MEPASSSSRSGSSSSPWTEEAGFSIDTLSSVSEASTGTAEKPPPPNRRPHAPPRSRLSKAFRSPLKQSQSQQSMESSTIPPASSKEHSPERAGAQNDCSSSSASIRKQRQALEARLLMLQQANQCLRDNAFAVLPQDIARWREAGQAAAQDLWKMTGADAGDWSGLSSIPSRGDYGLESPPSSLAETSGPSKRRGADSPEPSHPPLLLRRRRLHSPGADEQAAALLSTDEQPSQSKGEDSQGAASEASLPELSELLRRSQSVLGASSTPKQRQSILPIHNDGTTPSSQYASSGKGIERKWNIGSMLDMLGADKATLSWDVDEEDFVDSLKVKTS